MTNTTQSDDSRAAAAEASPSPEERGSEEPLRKKKKTVEAAVRIEGVVKRFGAKVAVDNVSITVKQGSVYGLIGPNGAGKTTTFSMLAGFLRPTQGSLEVLGFSPTQVDALRGRLGVLPQDAILPGADYVGEFLVHMGRLQGMPRGQAEGLARQGLHEVGGQDWWKQRCSSLSHGMAKRVAIAQAFLGEPEVVLLDEPTAGLDPKVAYEIRQYVKSKRKKCTVIISSHNLHELEEICDAAAILDRGKLIVSGTMASLTAANHEVRIKVRPQVKPEGDTGRALPGAASSQGGGGAPEPYPLTEIRGVPHVNQVDFEADSQEIVVTFDKRSTDAETIIGQTLWILLHHQVRISGVSKGRGLEQRVMDLTD